MYLLRLKYERLNIMQNEIRKNKDYTRIKENEDEQILRRKYERKNVGKGA